MNRIKKIKRMLTVFSSLQLIIVIIISNIITAEAVSYNMESKRITAKAGSFTAEDDMIVICIDPGHGGENLGAEYHQNGGIVEEKWIDLKIGLFLKEELEQYQGVKVIITRTGDTDVSLEERANIAKSNGADYFISVHNNADIYEITEESGCMVLMTCGQYQPANSVVPNIEATSLLLCKSIVNELTALGIGISKDFEVDKTGGILRRPYSPAGQAKTTKYYPDGSVQDYYGVIKANIERGIPAIIIEHAYGNNISDYNNYLSDDDKLRMLAKADARGIAAALHLKHK